MSVNYYLDSPDNDAGHLGKWSNCSFTAYAPPGIDSLEAWTRQMDGRTVYAEYGLEITQREMVDMATRRVGNRAAARSPNYSRGEFMDGGALFTPRPFC